jgi:hypothetical protein
MAETFFADTTVVYYLLHSHSLLRTATTEVVREKRVVVTRFVRGEYIRGFVAGLIELFTAIREERSVRDGIIVFNAEASRRPRRLANAFQTTAEWLAGHLDWEDVSKTLRRLGEYIRALLVQFDTVFPNRVPDLLRCEFGVMNFPEETYDEDHILDFYAELERIRAEPDCDQCQFRQAQRDQLATASIDLYSETQREKYKQHDGYVSQAEWIDKAIRSPKTSPACWYCDRLGDSIIALCAPDGTAILTGDHASFPALADILGKPIELIPTLNDLRKQSVAAPPTVSPEAPPSPPTGSGIE